MSLDGALSALSAAFDAATALLIESAEAELDCLESQRIPPHNYGWSKFASCIKGTHLSAWPAAQALIVEVDAALAGQREEVPVGWLALLRRLRNRATHQTTLPRTWSMRGEAPSVVGVTDMPNHNPAAYLRGSCDRLSDLTERMHGLANQWGYIGARTPLQRVP